MKALTVFDVGQAGFQEVAEPGAPGEGEAVLKVKALGFCGSDLATFLGRNPLVSYPRVVGHELAGEVIEADDPAGRIAPGDAVMVDPIFPCGNCIACRRGRYNCCVKSETLGVQRDGGAMPFLRLPVSKLHKPPRPISWEELALVEPMAIGFHAVRRGAVDETDTVCLLGCGAIGLGALQAAKAHGARVLAADIKDASLELAERLGADATVNSAKADLAGALRRFTDGEGATVVLEAVGLPSLIEQTVELVANSGRIVLVGYAKGAVTFDPKVFLTKELDLRGSRNSCRVFPELLDHVAENRIRVRELITHRFPFEEGDRALQYWSTHTDDVIKIVLEF